MVGPFDEPPKGKVEGVAAACGEASIPYASFGVRGIRWEIGECQGKREGFDRASCRVLMSRRMSFVIKILRGQFQRALAHFV